jgi:hypothetical protein
MSEPGVPLAMLEIGLLGVQFSVNCDIIHVYREPSLGHFLTKDRVHHHLEGGRRIGETEEHDHVFKEPFWGEKGSFPFICLFNLNVVVSPSDVKLGEQGTSAEAINGLGNEGGDISVFLSPFVDWAIVLYWS